MFFELTEDHRFVFNHTPSPENVCGGVWVDALGKFVPVKPGNEVTVNEETGVRLWEYADASGEVRACLLSVPPDQTSPEWRIKTDAGGGEYYEVQQVVAGSGTFVQKREGEPHTKHDGAIPEPLGQSHEIWPGHAFMVRAGAIGTHVIAFFPGAPFDLSYEEQVAPPS